MVKRKISNRSSIQLAALLVAVAAVAAFRGRPVIAIVSLVSVVVSIITVQKLGENYDWPLPWWLFFVALVLTIAFVWVI